MPSPMSRLAMPAAVAASVIALAGCASTASGGGDDGTLQVVATTTQVGDFAREIVGDAAEVTQLLQPGQSAHAFDATPEALQALAEADVLVINGAGLEEWLDDTIEASGFDGDIIDASEDAHVHEGEHGDEEHGDDEHADDDEHGDDEHGDEEYADEDEHGDDEHHHDGLDPHIWSDPHNVIHMVETIGEGLADADGADEAAIEQGTSDYVAQLEDLDAWVHESIDQVPEADRLLVTNHDTFSYLAEATGITVVGSVMPAFDDNSSPSAADIDELVAAIEETGVQAVFSESSIDPSLAETIAAEADVEVYSGEDALYADSLGAEGTDGATYVGSQIHNVTLIVESWGAEPLAVPDTLTT